MSENNEEKSVPFYPDHLKLEAMVALAVGIIILIVGVIGLFYPVGLGDPADAMDTPEHIKPEWYFLFLYQLLRFIPETIGATLPVIAVLILAIWPFLDSKADKDKKASWIRFWVAGIVLILVIALTIWGEVS